MMNQYCMNCMSELNEDGTCPNCGQQCGADDVIYRLKPGTILNKKFIVGNCLGEGGFGITYIGRDMTLDRKVAIKEYFPNGYVNRNNNITQVVTATTENRVTFFKKGLENFLGEARNVAKLNDVPGIVDVREYFEENNTAYIIMEYLDGINLSSYLKQNGNFPPAEIFQLMYPITRSLQKIHEEGIIHRDISPDNIMYLKNGTLKLMDFGSARYFTNSQKEMSVMIKQGYAPEEQYSKNGDQGPWTDVYGLCATMYRCITGLVPQDAIDRIKNDTLKSPKELGFPISDAMNNTLMHGLAVFKNDRCKDMNELSYLMEKAMNNEDLADNRNDYYARINRTMNADSVYPTAPNDAQYNREPFSVDEASMNRNPRSYTNNPMDNYTNQGGYPQGGGYPPPDHNKGNNKNMIIIAITIFLCVAILAATAIFVFNYLNAKDEEDTNPTVTSEAGGGQDEETKAEETIEPETMNEMHPETTAPTGAPVKPAFSSATASSRLDRQRADKNSEWKTYEATNALKNDGTCWCEGAKGYGINEYITFKLTTATTVSGIDIINGYAGTESQYENNAIPTKIKLEFSDGSSEIKTLKVNSTKDRKTIQKLTFNPVNTSYVKIIILDTTSAKYEDTCITYVAPVG